MRTDFSVSFASALVALVAACSSDPARVDAGVDAGVVDAGAGDVGLDAPEGPHPWLACVSGPCVEGMRVEFSNQPTERSCRCDVSCETDDDCGSVASNARCVVVGRFGRCSIPCTPTCPEGLVCVDDSVAGMACAAPL